LRHAHLRAERYERPYVSLILTLRLRSISGAPGNDRPTSRDRTRTGERRCNERRISPQFYLRSLFGLFRIRLRNDDRRAAAARLCRSRRVAKTLGRRCPTGEDRRNRLGCPMHGVAVNPSRYVLPEARRKRQRGRSGLRSRWSIISTSRGRFDAIATMRRTAALRPTKTTDANSS